MTETAEKVKNIEFKDFWMGLKFKESIQALEQIFDEIIDDEPELFLQTLAVLNDLHFNWNFRKNHNDKFAELAEEFSNFRKQQDIIEGRKI